MGNVRFVDGLLAKKPHEKAPEFVKCALSIRREELAQWLLNQEGEWLSIDVKESRNGKWYCAVNEWKKGGDAPDYAPVEQTARKADDIEIPF